MSERPITERANPASARLDELPTRALVELMNDEDARVAPAVRGELDAIARAIDAIAERMRGGGRLLYLGAGTSGRLGVLDASECPPTFGIPAERVVGLIAGGVAALTNAEEGAEDRGELAVDELTRLQLGRQDALVGISASGRTPYVLAGIDHARALGALTIGLTCNPDTLLARAVEIAIAPVTGPEVVTGSTRLKAGTATKLVLNMLSTGVMVRLGRVRGNQMVAMRATNEKLARRGAAIVAEIGGVDEARASELLAQHGGSVSAAIAAAAMAAVTPPRSGADRGSAENIGVPTPDRYAGSRAVAWIAGIDGGGSRTRIALAPAATLATPTTSAIGSGSATPSEIHLYELRMPCNLTTDFEGSIATIEAAVAAAFVAAKQPRVRLAALAVAAAGSGDRERARRAASRLIERGVAEHVTVVHDAAAVLAASTSNAVGIALIAGTGSFCFGRDARGRTQRAGGLGNALGDEGSAFALGKAALTIATRTADGRGARHALVQALFERLGTSDARAIAERVQAGPLATPAAIAELAPLVTAAAAAGDPTAVRLLDHAAAELALLVKTVARALDFGRDAVPLAIAGGLLDATPSLVRGVVHTLASLGVVVAVQPRAEPVQGALAIARRLHADGHDHAVAFTA